MRFILLISSEEAGLARASEADRNQMFAAYGKYTQDLKAAGVMLAGDPLVSEKEGARVRVRGGKRTVTDGPFAETKEVLGGYYVVNCATKTEAIDWAAKCPGAEYGTMEVRQIRDM